jgi:hypothetical protein
MRPSSTILDLAVRFDEVFNAPLNTTKLAPVTESSNEHLNFIKSCYNNFTTYIQSPIIVIKCIFKKYKENLVSLVKIKGEV